MNIGLARSIFDQIDTDFHTIEEKGLAIYTVLNMATDNSIRKADYRRALKWLWNEHFEIQQTEPTTEEGSMVADCPWK